MSTGNPHSAVGLQHRGGGEREQQQEQQRVQQLYPPPPEYFKLVETNELQPPPPIQGEYQQFGELFSTEDGLAPLRVQRLYDVVETHEGEEKINFREQLLMLHRELMASFLELLAVLVDAPSQYARQVETVGLVLRNMMHLTNQLRPHQARQELYESLRQQCMARQEAITRLREAMEATDSSKEEAIKILRKDSG